jgi:hypothetical protein
VAENFGFAGNGKEKKKKGVILMIHDLWRRILGLQGMEKA